MALLPTRPRWRRPPTRIARDREARPAAHRARPPAPAGTAAPDARVLYRGHAFLRNLRGGGDDLGRLVNAVALSPQPPVVQAWAALTGVLLGR
jgi:hypothetical protein